MAKKLNTAVATKEVVPIRENRAAVIKPPNLRIAEYAARGTAPLVQHRMWKKAELMHAQEHPEEKRGKKNRKPRDFEADYQQAAHMNKEGKYGIPASGIRNAMIAACRLVDFKMTHAKCSIFVEADDYDQDDMPIVFIEGKPHRHDAPTRNADGSCDVRARPMWREWSAVIRIRYDADQFTFDDVTNLLERAGQQIGICEGRPFSKNSAGMGWGTFSIRKD